MTQVLTDTGLNLPENYTEDEFFEAGRLLAKIEHGMHWAIGDWYNAITWGSKEAACEKAGLNFETARQYGRVAAIYQSGDRSPLLGFKHHLLLVTGALTPDQRRHLLAQAEHNKWASSRLVKERNHLLGRKPPEVPPRIEGEMEQVLSELPKSATKKTKDHIRKIFDHMKSDFHKEVSARTADQAARFYEKEKEAEKERDKYRDLQQNLDGLMTEDEYRLICGCLHPDRAPEDRRAKFTKAFTIFRRLEKTINRSMPKVLRERRGWSA